MWYEMECGTLIEIKTRLVKTERTRAIHNGWGVEPTVLYLYGILMGSKEIIFESKSIEERDKEFEKIKQKLLTT